MGTTVSNLAYVEPGAELGEDVFIGPFCFVGKNVRIGDNTRLDSHVSIAGHTTIGCSNRFFAGSVIGAEPQDVSYRSNAPTSVEIGDHNIFREGVTVNRGAEKEDHCTRIGNHNMLMSNSHVAHNCRVYNNVILVNGVLLGGHVHVQDWAIVSGNSAVHHFATVGTMAFVGGQSRVTVDAPPYMMSAGNEKLTVHTINIIGLRRRGLSESTIRALKQAHRLIYREHLSLDKAVDTLHERLEGVIPIEVSNLIHFLEKQREGRSGRAREAFRNQDPAKMNSQESANIRRAA